MVKVKWKLGRERVYLKIEVLGEAVYYWFPKRGHHKRFHPRSIFTRQIHYPSYRDRFLPEYISTEGWIEGEIGDRLIKEKLGIQALTWVEFYEQLRKAR
jgi:hypothetical protein